MIFTNSSMFEFEPTMIANVNTGDVAATVARYIGKYEKQAMREALGDCLYKEVQDSYQWDSEAKRFVQKDSITDAIKALVDGIEYDAPETNDEVITWSLCGCGSQDCKKRYWKGFVQTDEVLIGDALASQPKSIWTEYVYYWYLYETRTVTTGTGQQKLAGENSSTMENFSKRVDAYNEYVKSVIGGRPNETPLYRFLKDHKSDYPTWVRNCNIKFKDKW